MGLEVSTEAVREATVDRKWFNFNRHLGVWPTLYDSMKTPVTVDVLEAGLILAVVMLAFCFLIILPGIRGRERIYCSIRVAVSLFLGACIILCNWGQYWETDQVHVTTQYKAFTNQTIEGTVGIRIGLRNVNITLKGDPENQIGERINYNERFWWSFPWHQGRIGFGPFAAEVSQEFREAQYKGLPYPILWVAEYFTFDGEGIRWGRNYRGAGFYTHIMEWTAFCCWIIANILFFMNPRLGAYMTMIMGGFMLVGNILWASIRNFNDLVIPFDNHEVGPVELEPHYGWCFWLNMVAGLISVLLGFAIFILDMVIPDTLATFFGVDVLKDYEEFYPETEDDAPGDAANGAASKAGSHVESASEAAHGNKRASAVPQFRKRGFTIVQKRRPIAPPRVAKAPLPEPDEDDGMELYENASEARRLAGGNPVDVAEVSFQGE